MALFSKRCQLHTHIYIYKYIHGYGTWWPLFKTYSKTWLVAVTSHDYNVLYIIYTYIYKYISVFMMDKQLTHILLTTAWTDDVSSIGFKTFARNICKAFVGFAAFISVAMKQCYFPLNTNNQHRYSLTSFPPSCVHHLIALISLNDILLKLHLTLIPIPMVVYCSQQDISSKRSTKNAYKPMFIQVRGRCI